MSTLTYRVHSVVPGQQSTKVEFEGAMVDASIPSLEVELTWDTKDGRDHGSMTLRGVGKDIGWMKDTFVQDGEVLVNFAKVEDTGSHDPEPSRE
jgi:hypothetical protein